MAGLLELPEDLLIKIAQYLDPIDLARLGAVCRLFNNITSDPRLHTYLDLEEVSPSLMPFKTRCKIPISNVFTSRSCVFASL
eukprot:m.127678 g.127678  ORF g.127678 m.127678 type:complete len:82 (-) comp14716_c0_seq2:1344-1589(-)